MFVGREYIFFSLFSKHSKIRLALPKLYLMKKYPFPLFPEGKVNLHIIDINRWIKRAYVLLYHLYCGESDLLWKLLFTFLKFYDIFLVFWHIWTNMNCTIMADSNWSDQVLLYLVTYKIIDFFTNLVFCIR